jgi:hypothetical protein
MIEAGIDALIGAFGDDINPDYFGEAAVRDIFIAMLFAKRN